ncbi:ketose-bisphosphate aldolase [Patescibacteria group bacterium]|nr:ketose-bisphosphate aldolase [Patescibacteria group bacterium]
MSLLIKEIEKAQNNKTAIGHFNISNLEMFKGVLAGAMNLSPEGKTPVIIGLSESERKYIGTEETVGFVQKLRTETNYPVFINADHCKTYESAEEAVQAGFDSVVIDNSKLSLNENIEATKRTTAILKGIKFDILVEGEMGFIGGSSKLLDQIPSEVQVTEDTITKALDAKRFAEETGIDMLSPAVGNLHGVLKNFLNPRLNMERIKEIAEAVNIPLVLHGGSGVAKEDIQEAVKSGMSVVHFSTDLRVAFRKGLIELVEDYFPNNPNEVAPYKYLTIAVKAVEEVVTQKLELLN